MPVIKLDKWDVNNIKLLMEQTQLTDKEIAEIYSVSRGHITKIRNKKRWNYEYERIEGRNDIYGQRA